MATERVVDLENRRYADREYDGTPPDSTAGAEEWERRRTEQARARLVKRIKEKPGTGRMYLDRSDLLDLLLLLGVHDW